MLLLLMTFCKVVKEYICTIECNNPEECSAIPQKLENLRKGFHLHDGPAKVMHCVVCIAKAV